MVESPPEGYPRHPPPLREPFSHILHVVDGKWELQVRDLLKGFTRGGGGGRAGWVAKWCHWLTDHRIDCKLKTKIANTILLLCYLNKICLSLTVGFWQASANYIVKGGYKREPEPMDSPQSTTLCSTVNTSVKEGSRPQQHSWNSKALFFPTEISLHIVYI